ncbi:MAG: TlyA family RNA methyltransferase, partial [Acidimicrobiales bacterium]|nr:TlyA family RNA methyltransferase [Acidimicrobiales bacterium]
VDGAPADKPARLVAPDEALALSGPPPRFVSRGGEKLDAALRGFDVDVHARRVLDAGASTGGFTDCVLQAGATAVVAIDVGRGQLHRRLVTDPRVELRERTNVRHLTPGDVDPAVDVVVADLSFISLRTVLDALLGVLVPGGDLVLLVKPQFEAGKAEASKHRGVITDPAVWSRVLRAVAGALRERGAAIMGVMASPLRGADGNVEFLLHAVAPDGDHDSTGLDDLEDRIDLLCADLSEGA